MGFAHCLSPVGRVRRAGRIGHFQALNWLRVRCKVLLCLWICGGLACCRIWFCLAASSLWQGAKAHGLFQNLLSYSSYASYTSYLLAHHKREALFCFSIAFGRRRCYYLARFKDSDSWNMIFEIPAAVKEVAGWFTRIG